MRTILLALSATILTVPVAHAQDNAVSADVELGAASSWLFQKQQLNAFDKPFADANLTVVVDDFYFNGWHGLAIDGTEGIVETDLKVGGATELKSGITVDGSLAIFLLPGKNAVSVEVGVSVPIAKNLTGRVSYERIRGGFVDDAIEIKLTYVAPLAERWTLDASPAVTYSTWAGGTNLNATVGITYQATDSLRIRAGVGGYFGNKDSDVAFRLSVGFGF